MFQKKVIVVFGATGAQGGGLAHAILNDPQSEFSVRAVTRDIHSAKAKELAGRGAEVVAADIDDPESMKKALAGAYGAFFVTFFWAHYSAEKETTEAKHMAETAKSAGLKLVIWSTLEDVRKFIPLNDNSMPTLHGKYKVPHFDGKGEADQFFIDAGVPVIFMLASFYWDNIIYFGAGPKRGADGKLAITFPLGNKKMAGIAAADIGKCAYGIIKKREELVGQRVGIAGEHISCADMAKSLSKALGEEVVYNEVTPDMYRSFGFPGAGDLGNMFQFYRDFEKVCNTTRDVNFSRVLNPELKSFDEWLAENAKAIPLI